MIETLLVVGAVSVIEIPFYDEHLNVTVGDAVSLPCPVYRSSVPVHITWLNVDTYEPVVVDQTAAISHNGRLTTLLFLDHELIPSFYSSCCSSSCSCWGDAVRKSLKPCPHWRL